MSRRKHIAGEPIVRWAVTDQHIMGELTVERVIKLHHFMVFRSDRELLDKRLEAYAPPTEKEPWWVLRVAERDLENAAAPWPARLSLRDLVERRVAPPQEAAGVGGVFGLVD